MGGEVPWIVLTTPLEVSAKWVDDYKAAIATLPQTFVSLTNNRPVQPLNNRTVVKSIN